MAILFYIENFQIFHMIKGFNFQYAHKYYPQRQISTYVTKQGFYPVSAWDNNHNTQKYGNQFRAWTVVEHKSRQALLSGNGEHSLSLWFPCILVDSLWITIPW